jgi:assimilatory nitrate reductase catalytic subunit
MLAAHMDFTTEDIDRVRRFWRAPRMAVRPGLKAVQMFDAIASGNIRALWVMATNPAVSLPRADRVRAALGRLDFFAVSDVVLSNDTMRSGAHVLLPAAAWGEKDGTVTNSERRISRQRAFLALPGEARPDWWIVGEVARRLGFAGAFSYRNAAAVFREHAALSAFENDGARGFHIGGLADATDGSYARMAPVQWPARSASETSEQRVFANGIFPTPDGKARFIPIAPPALASATRPERPLRLNTGRVRDQWHTMTRTGRSPRLGAHVPEPCIAVHPDDARTAGLADGGLARITSIHGTTLLRVRADPGQKRGDVFAPIHWSAETSSHGRIGALVDPATDPHSGQPEMKATPVALAPARFGGAGFLLARGTSGEIRMADTIFASSWWSRVSIESGRGWLIATDLAPTDALTWFETRFAGCEITDFIDEPAGTYRGAAFSGGRIEAALFLGRPGDVPGWDSIKALFAAESVAERRRRLVLHGSDADGGEETGAIVCACFGVAAAAIVKAIRGGSACTVAEIGAALKAGTNCGSCMPELRGLLARTLAGTAEKTP